MELRSTKGLEILLDTEERLLVSGLAASRVGAEADPRGLSSVERVLGSERHGTQMIDSQIEVLRGEWCYRYRK